MIETLIRKLTVITAVCLVSTLFITQPALAHDASMINSAIVDEMAGTMGEITLTGEGLGTRRLARFSFVKGRKL